MATERRVSQRPAVSGRRPSAALIAIVLAVLPPGSLWPAVITVEGDCALVEAIIAANSDSAHGGCPAGSGADTIVLTGDVTLTAVAVVDAGNNGLPTVVSEITIEANGHTIERSSGALSDFRIGRIDELGELTLRNATVSGGNATAASGAQTAGAFWNGGDLTVEDSTLVSNHADLVAGAIYNTTTGSLFLTDALLWSNDVRLGTSDSSYLGGAVANAGYLLAARTTFRSNIVGGIYTVPHYALGGAIYNFSVGTAMINDSTLESNNVVGSVTERGSAIFNSGFLTLTNSTVSGNGSLSSGAGAIEDYVGGDGGVELTNVTLSGNNNYALVSNGTIVADATLIAGTNGPNCSGTVTGLNSAADDSSCGPIPDGLTGLDPALEDNGGPTETHALQAGSNAIDGAGFCGLPADQRGAPRVGACDIGAFEYMGCPRLVLADDTVTGTEIHEECSISAGPNFQVVGPSGDLTLIFGEVVELGNGFSIGTDGRMTVERDPSLLLVDPEAIAADRERRRLANDRPPVEKP